MNQNTPSSQQIFNGLVNAPGSQFGCTTVNQEKTLDQLFTESVNEIRSGVQAHFSNDVQTRQSILGILNRVEIYFQDNSPVLAALIAQVSCRKDIKPEVKYNFLVLLINFMVSTTYHNESALLPELPELATRTSTKKCWAFSAAATTSLGLDHHLGAVADYIASDPSGHIKDGDCFIFKLLTNCTNCNDGKLLSSNGIEKGLAGILLNFFKGNKLKSQSQNNDFFSLEARHKVNFKCGECLCNITRLDDSRGVI